MPAVVIERPKLSRPMWEALKFHVTRERQRKKQEQEADAEVERQRREREDQQKEQEMTLEETKEQVAQCESRLSQLKEDKHQLFLQLKKVLNEDDTRRRIKESNFNDMMLLHGYSTGPSLSVHPSNHAPGMYIPNLGHPRPMYKPIKEETVVPSGAPPSGAPQQPLYPTSISLIPQLGHQGQTNPKRSHSPSPPPPQMYHTYKPPGLSSYNSKNVSNPYGGSPAVPGSIFYTHSVSVSAAHSAANTVGYQLPPGSMYSYPQSHPSSSRPSYSIQTPPSSKDDGPPPTKHHASMYMGQGSLPSIPSRSHVPRNPGPPMSQGYLHQSMEHLISKSSSPYGSSDQEKFFMSSHGPLPPPGSGSSGSTQSSSGLRPHSGGLLAPISIPGQSHQSSIAIQQSNHGKGGSITSGLPLRPPLSTASYHTTASVSHAQSPRLTSTQSGNQQQQQQQPPPSSRYYSNPN